MKDMVLCWHDPLTGECTWFFAPCEEKQLLGARNLAEEQEDSSRMQMHEDSVKGEELSIKSDAPATPGKNSTDEGGAPKHL